MSRLRLMRTSFCVPLVAAGLSISSCSESGDGSSAAAERSTSRDSDESATEHALDAAQRAHDEAVASLLSEFEQRYALVEERFAAVRADAAPDVHDDDDELLAEEIAAVERTLAEASEKMQALRRPGAEANILVTHITKLIEISKVQTDQIRAMLDEREAGEPGAAPPG